jgi:peptidoglycan pentaglycine glycine transferase (the first glycine)
MSATLSAREADEADRDRHNAFVASSPTADALQSWEWGELKRRTGWTPRRFLVEEGGEIVAVAQVLARRPVRAAPPLLYAPRGPVVAPGRPDALAALVDGVRRAADGAFLLACDPPVEASSAEARALEAAGFRPVPAGGFGGVQPKAVMVLDLSPPLEEIFARFHPKWRYNVRLAERRGVTVASAGRAELSVFYDLLLETARRDGFAVRDRRYFELLLEILEPAGRATMFLARYQDRPIAGAICLGIGGRLTYTYGASSSQHRAVMPNHLLQWHVIRWAKEHGYRIYDLRGVSPVRDGRPVDPRLAGLNRFKEGFGARYVEYAGTFELPLRPVLWRAWRAAAPLARGALRRLRRRRRAAAGA